jgi:caffeoyl-CoA O-methyltransferase
MNDQTFLAVDEYISGLFVREDQALKSTTQSITAAGIPDGSVTPNQGSFLQLMARLVRAQKILEIGTFAAYSSIWLARGLAGVPFTTSTPSSRPAPSPAAPPTTKLITLESNPIHAALAKANIERAGLKDIVDLRVGKALDLLPELEKESAGPFDLIFIDADKALSAAYFHWALRLSRPGTLLIFDNVIREGKVLDKTSDDESVQGVQRLNQLLAEEPTVSATILTNMGVKRFDGIALAVVL